jgi:hypothetical protein
MVGDSQGRKLVKSGQSWGAAALDPIVVEKIALDKFVLSLRLSGEQKAQSCAIADFNISNDADRVKGFGVPDFIVSNTLIALAQMHCSRARE